jgi:hypothetical protein
MEKTAEKLKAESQLDRLEKQQTKDDNRPSFWPQVCMYNCLVDRKLKMFLRPMP